ALLVDAVAGLVKDAEERLVEMASVVARGDAAITGTDAAAKRMRRHIEPAGVEVEADGGGGFAAETLLLLDRILARKHVAGRFSAGRGNGGDKRHKFGTQGGEQSRDLRGGGARLVLVEQGIVRNTCEADGPRLLTQQRDDLFQLRL